MAEADFLVAVLAAAEEVVGKNLFLLVENSLDFCWVYWYIIGNFRYWRL